MQALISEEDQTQILKKGWQVFWHLLFWISIVSLFIYLAHSDVEVPSRELLIKFLLYPAINITLFYLNFLIFIPNFLNKKRYWAYTAFIIITIIAYSLFKYGIGFIYYRDIILTHMNKPIPFNAYFITTIFVNII